MAVPAVGDKFLVTFSGKLCNQTILTTFWYILVDKGTAITVQDVEDALLIDIAAGTHLLDRYLKVVPTNYTLEEVWIQKIYPDRIFKSVFPIAGSGGQGFVAPNANSSLAIERRGEHAIRKEVGGIRFPTAVNVTQFVDGVLTDAAYKTDMVALAAKLKLRITTAGPLCVLDPIVYNPKFPTPLSRTVIQTTPKFTVRTMHRRTVGLGI